MSVKLAEEQNGKSSAGRKRRIQGSTMVVRFGAAVLVVRVRRGPDILGENYLTGILRVKSHGLASFKSVDTHLKGESGLLTVDCKPEGFGFSPKWFSYLQ